ncbi:RHS repeat-associated core domain containing protein [Nitzschia inconspicua]|uniref:RHS repeat-associated core domain containing protein n=1 Tax=Nitzschia inconspicua TaxID=303405 RepID=A0A9K3Q386_9STRA|nr:RHS repeat-associated core domain containing protein [Nitzschia inconspicua]
MTRCLAAVSVSNTANHTVSDEEEEEEKDSTGTKIKKDPRPSNSSVTPATEIWRKIAVEKERQDIVRQKYLSASSLEAEEDNRSTTNQSVSNQSEATSSTCTTAVHNNFNGNYQQLRGKRVDVMRTADEENMQTDSADPSQRSPRCTDDMDEDPSSRPTSSHSLGATVPVRKESPAPSAVVGKTGVTDKPTDQALEVDVEEKAGFNNEDQLSQLESNKMLLSAPPTKENEHEEVQKKSEWWIYVMFGFILVTTTVGLGCVILFVFGAGDPQYDYFDELQKQVQGLSEDVGVFDEPSSSQSLALNWLAYMDGAEVDYKDTTRVQARYSLAVLFFATHGATQWIDHLSFLSPQHECEWNDGTGGVFCDPETSALRSLIIDSNNLRGSVPFELSALKELQKFWLQDNRITGTIPSFNFPVLEDFRLAQNGLEGTIPSSLANMTQLRILDLSNNQLVSGLPQDLWHLPLLETLHLGANQLSGAGTDVVLSDLRHLNLTTNKFDGDLNFLGSFPKLQMLDLSSNDFQADTMFDDFSTMTDLVTVDLSRNRIMGPIPSNLGQLTKLSFLNFAENLLTGTFPWFSFNNSQLTHIIMADNLLTGALPLDIFRFESIEMIDFDRNYLSGIIPLGMGGTSSLRSLRIAGNAITGQIPPILGNLGLLMNVDISDNSLTGSLPESLANLSSLRLLDVHGNGFTGTIPRSMKDLKEVQRIALHGNNLSGTIDFLCSVVPPKPVISADCAGSEPKVICTCCDMCLI